MPKIDVGTTPTRGTGLAAGVATGVAVTTTAAGVATDGVWAGADLRRWGRGVPAIDAARARSFC